MLFVACQVVEDNKDFDIQRLAGRWEDTGTKSDQVEVWTRHDDKTLWGRGFVLDGNDTTFIEYLAIQPVNDTLSYLARVSSQNSGEIIRFPMKTQSGSKIVFENMQHDFPQRIVYELKNDSVLDVFVEGVEGGTNRRIDFNFEKK
ncbi:MAG: DUF6265 family protein [Flavobacteriales bacterium]|nr:DUF6265 family protein [Flavobacteriales bacterium]